MSYGPQSMPHHKELSSISTTAGNTRAPPKKRLVPSMLPWLVWELVNVGVGKENCLWDPPNTRKYPVNYWVNY